MYMPSIHRMPVVFARPFKENIEDINIKVRLKEEEEIKPDVKINNIKVINNNRAIVNIKTIKSK